MWRIAFPLLVAFLPACTPDAASGPDTAPGPDAGTALGDVPAVFDASALGDAPAVDAVGGLDAARGGETNCSDGVDDDGDGSTDCADSDCAAVPRCAVPTITLHVATTARVVSSSHPIDCADDCTYRIPVGEFVALEARAAGGRVFRAWSGGTCPLAGRSAHGSFIATSDAYCSADFVPFAAWSRSVSARSIAAGRVVATRDGGLVAATLTATYSASGHDELLIVRLSASGDALWTRRMGRGDESLFGLGLALDAQERPYLVAGHHLVALDTDGATRWIKRMPYVALGAVAVDEGGHVVVAGTTPAVGTTEGDLFVASLSDAGVVAWRAHYTSHDPSSPSITEPYAETPWAMAAGAGGIHIVGDMNNTAYARRGMVLSLRPDGAVQAGSVLFDDYRTASTRARDVVVQEGSIVVAVENQDARESAVVALDGAHDVDWEIGLGRRAGVRAYLHSVDRSPDGTLVLAGAASDGTTHLWYARLDPSTRSFVWQRRFAANAFARASVLATGALAVTAPEGDDIWLLATGADGVASIATGCSRGTADTMLPMDAPYMHRNPWSFEREASTDVVEDASLLEPATDEVVFGVCPAS